MTLRNRSADHLLDDDAQHGWTVVDMKTDWKQVLAAAQRTREPGLVRVVGFADEPA